MNVLRNDTGHRHHGELLKQFVFDNKVKVTYLAKGLGIHRTDVYRLYKQEVLPKSDLDLLEKLIGFKPSQSVTKVDEPTTKKDTSDQDPDTDFMVQFAGKLALHLKKVKEIGDKVEAQSETIKELTIWLGQVDLNTGEKMEEYDKKFLEIYQELSKLKQIAR